MLRTLLLIAVLASTSSAQTINRVGTTAAPFLKIGVGARVVGMGEAYTTTAADASALYWNPAGAAGLQRLQAIFLGLLVLAAGFSVFQGSNRATTQQNLDNRMQDNARVAMDVVARNLRRAGFLVNFTSYPIGQPVDGATAKLIVQNNVNAPDQVTVVGGTLTSLGRLQFNALQGTNTVVLEDVTGLQAGDVIGIGFTYSGVVQGPPAADRTVTLNNSVPTGALNMFFPGIFSAGTVPSGMDPARVRILTATTYQINPDAPNGQSLGTTSLLPIRKPRVTRFCRGRTPRLVPADPDPG